MKKISVIGATLLAAAVLCAAPISLHQSLSLSVDKAQARIGRPLTPGSVAGVHRRHVRRTYRRGSYYGGGYYPYTITAALPLSLPWPLLQSSGLLSSPLSLLVRPYRLVAALGRGPQHMLRPFFLSAVRSFPRRRR